MPAKTALVVDDSLVSRLLTKAIVVNKYPEWKIIEASNGQEALMKTESDDIDVMLIDVNMPGMNGLELAEKLKVRHPDARISLLTANIKEGTLKGADKLDIEFLAKPIKEDIILGFLEKLES